MNKNILQSLKVTTLALILSFGLSFAYAWTAPTTTPPGGNTAAPLNVSGTTQLKSGALGVNGLFHGYSDLYVDGNMKVGTTTSALLDVAGTIHSSGDVCTDQAGGKCLSRSGGGFGAWQTKSFATVYQAATDGIVLAGSTGTSIYGYTDSSNPPTTLRTAQGTASVINNLESNITMPVRKGDFWTVKLYPLGTYCPSCGGGDRVFWIPTGA